MISQATMSVYSYNSDQDSYVEDDYESDRCSVRSWDDQEDEDEYVPAYKRWPFADGYKAVPSVEFMKKNYFPPAKAPLPIPSRILEADKLNTNLIKTVADFIKYHSEAVKKLEDELTKAEADVKNSRSWQNLEGKSALVARLKRELEAAVAKRTNVVKEHTELVEKNRLNREIIVASDKAWKLWKEICALQQESIRECYSWVKPVETTAEVEAFGELLEKRVFQDGRCQLWFAPGTPVADLARGLRLADVWNFYCGETDGEPWIVMPSTLLKDPVVKTD